MLQTAHSSLPFPNNRRPTPRQTERRRYNRKRTSQYNRCRPHGNRSAEYETPFPRQEKQNSYIGYTISKIIKTEPDSLLFRNIVVVAVRTCMVVACSSTDRLIVAAARSRLAYR